MAYALRTFKGTVIKFRPELGFGYLKIDGGPEAHMHLRDFDHVGGDQIMKGTRIEYYLTQGVHGLNAIRCTILKTGEFET
jgi:cold shock CspA family protein